VPNNNVQRVRESLMMSKAELARKAGLSTLTIDRVEAGRACRLDTKRKILLALGMKISDKERLFGEYSVQSSTGIRNAPTAENTAQAIQTTAVGRGEHHGRS
jgi:DNA-binding XRE family transcriptional regulator